jgi:hypothetical protein
MGLYPKALAEYAAFAGIPRGPESKYFIVDPVHGSDTYPGTSFKLPLATVSAALAKCTTLHHDVVFVVASGTAITETAAIDWNKSLTHLVGLGAPTPYGKRTRIISGTDDLSPFVTVSGYGCIFKNLRIVHEQASDTGSLICCRVSGLRNYFENVEFAGPGTASSAIDGACALQIYTGAGESYFKDCVIGLDTVTSATGVFAMVVTGSGIPRVRFDRCIFAGYAGSTTAGLVEVTDGAAFDRAWAFRDCEFINLGASTMATCFLFTNPDSRYKRMLLINCVGLGFTDWDASNTGNLNTNMDVLTAGGIAGFLSATVVT